MSVRGWYRVSKALTRTVCDENTQYSRFGGVTGSFYKTSTIVNRADNSSSIQHKSGSRDPSLLEILNKIHILQSIIKTTPRGAVVHDDSFFYSFLNIKTLLFSSVSSLPVLFSEGFRCRLVAYTKISPTPLRPRGDMTGAIRAQSNTGNPFLSHEDDSRAQYAQTESLVLARLDDPDDLSYEGSDTEVDAQSSDIDGNRSKELGDSDGESSPSSPSDNGTPGRLNKFEGSRENWRRWTKRERQEVAALETIRSRDLSLHLYNAFALKQRAERLKREHSRELEVAENGDRAQSPPHADLLSNFAPTKSWTAWPLPANIVPRTTEKLTKEEDDDLTISAMPDTRPSAELEECLMAQMMKAATQKFEQREYKRFYPRKLSQMSCYGTELTVSEEENNGDPAVSFEPSLRPVVQADDEESKRIMRPEARHIISKLDELLLSLYQARHSYVATTHSSQPGDETENDYDDACASVSSSARHKRKRTQPSSFEGNHSSNAAPDELHSSTPSTPRSFDSKNHQRRSVPLTSRLGLRDWSDILGVASMAGWSNAAVMRAARRCADLFNQDMTFSTFSEGKVRLEQDEDGSAIWNYVENKQEVEKTSTDPVPAYIDKLKKRALFCPVEDCKRHKQGFSRNWNLEQHLKNKHPTFASRPDSLSEDH